VHFSRPSPTAIIRLLSPSHARSLLLGNQRVADRRRASASAHLARDDLVLALECLIFSGNVPNANYLGIQHVFGHIAYIATHLCQWHPQMRSSSQRVRCVRRWWAACGLHTRLIQRDPLRVQFETKRIDQAGRALTLRSRICRQKHILDAEHYDEVDQANNHAPAVRIDELAFASIELGVFASRRVRLGRIEDGLLERHD
jgi:hypothetical protein